MIHMFAVTPQAAANKTCLAAADAAKSLFSKGTVLCGQLTAGLPNEASELREPAEKACTDSIEAGGALQFFPSDREVLAQHLHHMTNLPPLAAAKTIPDEVCVIALKKATELANGVCTAFEGAVAAEWSGSTTKLSTVEQAPTEELFALPAFPSMGSFKEMISGGLEKAKQLLTDNAGKVTEMIAGQVSLCCPHMLPVAPPLAMPSAFFFYGVDHGPN